MLSLSSGQLAKSASHFRMTLLRLGRYVVDNNLESLKELPYIPVISKIAIPFVCFFLIDISRQESYPLNAYGGCAGGLPRPPRSSFSAPRQKS
jgi:hypothetical protein